MQQPKNFSLAFVVLTIAFMCLSGGRSLTPAAELASDSVQGEYQGYLPCADCPGIEYKLTLQGDGTYTESSFYTDRSTLPIVKTGSYTTDGDTVVLDRDVSGMNTFAVHPQGLRMLDTHRMPIAGALSRQYILTRQSNPNQTMAVGGTLTLMQKKLAQGIGFYAVGNEPSWSLDIDFDKGMRFKSLTTVSELNTPPGREAKAQDADVTRYFAEIEAGTLIVTVLRGVCVDTMSGERFPYRVRTEAKRLIDTDYTLFEGCGRYVVDDRLNDIWVLTRLGNRTLTAEDFVKGLPAIEFHLADRRVTGNAGCNRLSGSFQARGDKITFGQLATTRMACPNMAVEREYLSMITDKTLRYAIDEGRLVLTDDKDITLAFYNTDRQTIE
jgi:heat shock protein HslJ/uncharacterized membrane protein